MLWKGAQITEYQEGRWDAAEDRTDKGNHDKGG